MSKSRADILKRGDHLEELGVAGSVIFDWILERQSRRAWTGFIWIRVVTSSGLS
jgi:hypothetical protein